MTSVERPILVSIVSHGHGAIVNALLDDLALPGNAELVRVLLTVNLASERLSLVERPYPLRVVRNERPVGFAENHNTAFRMGMADTPEPYFCVLNPDVRMQAGVMAQLAGKFASPPYPALLAPAVFSSDGVLQDSARPWPTPITILGRVFGRLVAQNIGAVSEISRWDWLAGMFMVFDARAYDDVGGFDHRYFLYYEDVDICCRMRQSGYRLAYCPDVRVEHDARRDSHRRLAHLGWHVCSAIRFFFSPGYFRCRRLPSGEQRDPTRA